MLLRDLQDQNDFFRIHGLEKKEGLLKRIRNRVRDKTHDLNTSLSESVSEIIDRIRLRQTPRLMDIARSFGRRRRRERNPDVTINTEVKLADAVDNFLNVEPGDTVLDIPGNHDIDEGCWSEVHSVSVSKPEMPGLPTVSTITPNMKHLIVSENMRNKGFERSDSSDEDAGQGDNSESDDFSDFDSDDDDDMFNIVSIIPSHPPTLPYAHNPLESGTCQICLETKKIRKRLCCSFSVCEECMEIYLSTQVGQAIVKVECLNCECNSYIHRDEILARLPLDLKEKFYKFLIDANKDPKIKTCPQCSHVTNLDDYLLKMDVKKSQKLKHYKKYMKRVKKKGLEITCEKCQLEWCFPCQAPIHRGITCKKFKKGDQLVKTWASQYQHGQQNAKRCPKCKIYIQRTTGCDHMTCVGCKTSFCYRCGNRYWSIKLLGDHFSRFSPFGCRYNLLPDKPVIRRLVRGAVFSGKILSGIVLGSMAIVAGAGLLGISVVALPIIGGYQLHKHYKKNHNKNKNMQFEMKTEEMIDQNDNKQSSLPQIAVEHFSTSLPEWLVVDVQLTNSHQVEVLVHQTVSSGETEQSQTYTHHNDCPVQDGDTITVKEVEDEDGSTRVVAHIITKPGCSEKTDQNNDGLDEEQESTINMHGRCFRLELDGKTDGQTRDINEMLWMNTGNEDDGEDEAGLNETNGCFVNIFAKRLNSFHSVSVHENCDSKLPKMLKSKGGTWEKSKRKESYYTNSLDLQSLSAIMAAHCSEKEPKCQGQKRKQTSRLNHIDINVHANDSGDDDVDVSSVDTEFSCDIVTYL